MNKIKIAATIAFLASMLILAGAAVGQQTSVYTDNDLNYKKGLDLFSKEKYASAQKYFQKSSAAHKEEHSEVKINSDYYVALCAVQLFNKDAEDLLVSFIQKYPESPKVHLAYFHLATYKFRRKKYEDAIVWFEKVDVYDLTTDELAEYYFKLGYSYFDAGRLEEGSKMFYEIKDVETPYTSPALYYFSHIAYQQKKYETALLGFVKLVNDVNFAPVVPYYIAQIYYLQGRFDEVFQYAPPLLDSANTKRAPEIARLLGDSYYKTGKYKESIPYLEKYASAQVRISKPDAYQLGYAYYQTADYEKAVEYLKEGAINEDTLAQVCYYVIADCYLKQGNKNYARNSFNAAHKYDFDKKIKEDAHFNYAKLTYELSYHPFNEAIAAFQTYLKEYKGSGRSDEIYKYLLNAFLTTRNYKDALIALEAISKKTKDLEYAYQKVSYYRAVELYNAADYNSAIKHFDKALQYPLDKYLNAQCYYWKAEAFYNLKDFKASIANYKTFLFEPGAAAQPEYFGANYNLGYAFFNVKNYTEAISWFRKYTTIKPVEDPKRYSDALLRIADGYFISKDYHNSSDYYAEASATEGAYSDYALYQQSQSLGLIGKSREKIEILESLIKKYSASSYADDAKFEIGNTHFDLGENNAALKYFNMVEREHPQSSFVGKALLKQGLVLRNEKRNEEALAVLKKVAQQFANTDEADGAWSTIKSIYVETGKVEEFDDLMKSMNYTSIAPISLDSTYYEAAESAYMKGDCAGARKSFITYMEKYPQGAFWVNANYYMAECLFKDKVFDEALVKYNNVVNQPKNVFTERALARASKIDFDAKRYDNAIQNYLKLEMLAEAPENMLDAKSGLMQSNYFLDKVSEAALYAEKLVLIENVPAKVLPLANLIMGKAALEQNNLAVAQTKFQLAAANSKSEIGAEAKYNVAYTLFLKKEFKESEAIILNEFSEQFAYYRFWLAKAFILLADDYVALGDNFQAKATLQSIIDNYDGDDMKTLAIQKLNKIIESEKPKEEAIIEPPMEIEFNDPSIYDNKLFEEE